MSLLSKEFSTDRNEPNYITAFIVGDWKVINENLEWILRKFGKKTVKRNSEEMNWMNVW